MVTVMKDSDHILDTKNLEFSMVLFSVTLAFWLTFILRKIWTILDARKNPETFPGEGVCSLSVFKDLEVFWQLIFCTFKVQIGNSS